MAELTIDDFDPDDMFNGNGPKKDSSASSEESTTDEVFTTAPTPVKYAYDAYQEKLDMLKASGGSSEASRVPVKPRPGTEAHRA
jgi:hypothetical protein